MNPIPHQNKLRGLIQVAQFFLSTSGHQAARRRGMKQKKSSGDTIKLSSDQEVTRSRLSDGFIFDKDVLRHKDREYLIDVFKRASPDCNKIENFYIPLIDGCWQS